MRAFYGTANSMARVLPLGVEIGERIPRSLSPTSPLRLIRAPRSQVNQPRGFNSETAI